MDWKSYWNQFPNQFAKEEFLKQVGKTVQGQPISEAQVSMLISDFVQKLELEPNDFVLDLCCGNGLITSIIANKCDVILGVDFSAPLIEIAQEYHQCVNTSYFNLSVLDITTENLHISKLFTKIYMYEALQYFREDQFQQMIERLLAISSEKPTMLFTSVPDESKLWDFYNTPERRRDYEMRKSNGTEAIGTWWKKSSIQQVCSQFGLQCKFLPQPDFLHTAHYRFDVRIIKQ